LEDLIDNPMTTVDLLQFFESELDRPKLLSRVLISAESRKSGEIAPRSRSFEAMGKNNKAEICYLMATMAVNIAQVLLTQGN